MVVLAIVLLQPQTMFGAQSNFSGPLNSAAGYQESGTEIIDTNGRYIGNVSSTGNVTTTGNVNTNTFQVDSGTLINEFNCSSTVWNPSGVSSSTVATTTVVVNGATAGDLILLSIDTSTVSSTIGFSLDLAGTIFRTDSVSSTIFAQLSVPYRETAGVSFESVWDITTSTLRACYFSPNI